MEHSKTRRDVFRKALILTFGAVVVDKFSPLSFEVIPSAYASNRGSGPCDQSCVNTCTAQSCQLASEQPCTASCNAGACTSGNCDSGCQVYCTTGCTNNNCTTNSCQTSCVESCQSSGCNNNCAAACQITDNGAPNDPNNGFDCTGSITIDGCNGVCAASYAGGGGDGPGNDESGNCGIEVPDVPDIPDPSIPPDPPDDPPCGGNNCTFIDSCTAQNMGS